MPRILGSVTVMAAVLVAAGCGSGGGSGSDALKPSPATLPSATPSRVLRGTPTAFPGESRTTPTGTQPRTPQTGTATITPHGGTQTPTGTPTPASSGRAMLSIGHASGAPGAIVAIDVVLTYEDVPEIVATQNDLTLDLRDIALVDGEHGVDCAANPDIHKEYTVFAVAPVECGIDAHCEHLRAIVLSLENVDAIPSGSVLYTCRIHISPGASPGLVFDVPCSNAHASDARGGSVALACADGAIAIAAEPIPTPTPSPSP
jgi:hypothetical protein